MDAHEAANAERYGSKHRVHTLQANQLILRSKSAIPCHSEDSGTSIMIMISVHSTAIKIQVVISAFKYVKFNKCGKKHLKNVYHNKDTLKPEVIGSLHCFAVTFWYTNDKL